MSTKYVTSDNIKFYPSAYRQYTSGGTTIEVNPEARRNTEYNLTSRIAKMLKSMNGSFIVGISDVDSSLEFFIMGYYCKLLGAGITYLTTQFSSADTIYANIKVNPFTPIDNTLNYTQLYEVVNYANNNKELDDGTNFGGIAFSDSVDNSANYSLLLYKKIGGSFTLAPESLYPLTTKDIKDSQYDVDISKKFTTEDIIAQLGSIGTVDATSVNSDGVHTNILGAGDNQVIELNDDIIPVSNNILDLGTNSKKFAKIYATKFEGEAATATKWTSGITININKTNANDTTSVIATATGVDGSSNVNLTLPKLVPIGVSTATTLDHTTSIYAYNSASNKTTSAQTIGSGTLNITLPDLTPKANQLNGAAGSSTNPVYFNSTGVPTGTAWNNNLYNLLNYTLKYKSVYTYNPNSRSFYAYVGTSSNDYIYMDMFLLINFNGDRSLMNFVLNNPNPNEANHFTNVVYACQVTSPNSSGRVQIVLKYNTNLDATASSTGWTTVGENSEKIQSAVIHTLCLPNDVWN